MAAGEFWSTFGERLKSIIAWSWTYLWAAWFILVALLIYILRGPLKISENMSTATMYLNGLSPKFYMALTATSSLISGLILVFEWYYFKKNGSSFIEQVSLNHISPLIGVESDPNSSSQNSVPECKVWKNPLCLFRGAEYQRLCEETGKEALTYYDMNLSAQDHQTLFICDDDIGKPEYEIMQRAWRERNPDTRKNLAHEALEKNSECVPALILLAEEQSHSVMEVEDLFKQALKYAEVAYKKSQQALEMGHNVDGLHKRNTNLLIYIKRRLGMCARKLGKLKEAAKMFRDLMKEFPMMSVFNIHENLIEVLLELQSYADVQAVLAKYDDISLPKSATICYTAALLKARAVSERLQEQQLPPGAPNKRNLSATELGAIDAIHRAVEFNPHVPKYLVETKALILPPEHILKRGDSEAVAYAYFHLRHWKRVDGALELLQSSWEGTFRLIPYPLEKGHLFYPYPQCTEAADRELLPSFHELSVYPRRELPFFLLFTAGLCTFMAVLTFLVHQYPESTALVAKMAIQWISLPFSYLLDKLEALLPSNLLQQLTKI